MWRQPCAGVSGALAVFGAALFCASPATGAMISLSTHSSDETSAEVLKATFDFQVSGSTLTLTVANDTGDDDAYFLNQVFFNAGPSVTSLSLTTPADGWTLQSDPGVGRFGRFDYGLIGGVGNDPDMIAAGDSLVFTLAFTGAAAASDFTTFESDNPPGDVPSIVAAKFIRGPGDDSAFGAFSTLPTPGALSLMALAAASLLIPRRRG